MRKVLLLSVVAGFAWATPSIPPASAVVATVGTATITVGELQPIMRRNGVVGDPEGTRDILSHFLTNEAISQEAKRRGFAKDGVASDADIQRFIASEIGARPTYRQFRELGDELCAKLSCNVHEDVLNVLIASAGRERHQYARTVEARMNLGLLRGKLREWHDAHASQLSWRYPPSTGWTPPKPCCSYPSHHCPADLYGHEDIFSAPTWRKLDFAMLDPFLYQYRFISTGSGKSARFRVEARADLDCDGNTSAFFIEGSETATGLQTRPLQAFEPARGADR